MENNPTSKPESKEYDVEHPEQLNTPSFNSGTNKREGAELPAVENMNDEDEKVAPEDSNRSNMPKTDLGNDRKEDEKDNERIIRR